MKKFISILLIVVLAFGVAACGKDKTENVDTEPTQPPLTAEEKTVMGKWTLESVTDPSGNAVDLSVISAIPGAGVLFGTILSENPEIEFNDSRVIKFSMFNVGFSIPEPETLILSSEILGSDITLPITYGDDTFSFLIDGVYKLTFKKA